MPAPRFQHGFANDVFISYASEDDREEAGVRWVSRFEAELKSRLTKVSGQTIQIWRDNRLSGADRFGPEIDEQLVASAVLLPIVTPSYFRSQWCQTERARFFEITASDRGLYVGNKCRMVKAAKTRVPLDRYPQELREQLEFRFYVEEQNDTAREFHLSDDERVQRRFYTVVDDAAQAIEQVLRGLEAGGAPASKGFVYVADTSSDIEQEWDQLRRSLTQRGYSVLPQAPLRLRSGPEIERITRSDLSQCRLAVYPVGAYYGPIPERSRDRSITELQLESALADGRNGSLSRLVWVPPGINAEEERQRRVLGWIRTELPSRGFEIIESRLSEVETHITDRLERPRPGFVSEASGADERAEIYILCLQTDRDAARPVRDCLFDEGFEVKLQAASDEPTGALHMERLASADALLVYWGGADEAWLERMLTQLKKAKGLRNGRPILSRAIFAGDPATDAKRDYVTHAAHVLRAASQVPLSDVLRPMLTELRRGRPGA
jgi:hypothetical protein